MIFFFSILAMLFHGQSAATASEATAAPVSVEVPLGVEDWFDETIVCLDGGVACTPSLNVAAPSDTLSVASQLGKESARTYLQIPASSLPTGAVVTGGLLRMQLDTSATSGSVAPETALIQACTTTSPIPIGEALPSTPPTADCSVSAIGKNIGTPTTEVDFDLAPLAAKLSQPRTNLAIVSGVASAGTDPANATFHDVFPASTNPTLAGQSPTLSLTYTPGVALPATPLDSPVPTSNDSPSDAATDSATTQSSAAATASSAVPVTGTHTGTGTGTGPGPVSGTAPVTASGAVPPAVTPAAPSVAAPVSGTVAAVPAPVVVGAAAAAEPSPQAAVGGVVLGGGSQANVAKLGSIATTRYYDYPEVFFLPLLLGFGIFAMGRQLTRPLTPEEEQEAS